MSIRTIFENAEQVLVIKPRAIGDVLLSTPVLKNLHAAFPHLQIDFLCETFASDVVTGNPALRNVITFHKKHDSTLSIIRNIRKRKYDVVIDLFANPRTAMITRWSGAPHRIGFPFRGRAYAYTILVPPRGGEVHNVDFNLDVLRHCQVAVSDQNPFFPLNNDAVKKASEWYEGSGLVNKKVVGINPSGGWYTKKWSAEGYARLADRIADAPDTSVLFFWGPGENEDVENIRSMMKHQSHIIPKTTLKEMGAFLGRCSYVVSNDSGPMHIAASLGVPTLGIYGPTNPHLQGPFGRKNLWVRDERLDCLECNLTDCPIGNVCMNGLSVETVYRSYQQLTEQNR